MKASQHPWFRRLFWPLLIGGSLAYLFLLYYGILTYNYPVPPGDDSYRHLVDIDRYVRDGFQIGKGYPFGFHGIVYLVSRVFSLSTVDAMRFIAPLLLLTAAWAVTYATTRFVNRTAGLAAFFIYSFLAYQPLQTVYDGSFPNVFAAGTLLPLFAVAYVGIFAASKPKLQLRSALTALVLTVLIMLTHHLTTIYLVAVALVSAPWLLVYHAPTQSRRVVWLKIVTIAIIAVILLAGAYVSGLLDPALSLADDFVTINGQFPFLHSKTGLATPAAIYSLKGYFAGIGVVTLMLGGIGGLAVLVRMALRKPVSLGMVYVVIWSVVLFVVSRMTIIGFPVRAGRDLVLPVTILAAYVISLVWMWKWRYAKVGLVAVLILLSPLIIRDVRQKIHPLTLEHPMVRMTAEDVGILNQLPDDATVAVFAINQFHPFFKPNAYMLNSWWSNTPEEDIDWDRMNYILVEKHNPELVWSPFAKAEPKWDLLPNRELLFESQQTYKLVQLYRIIHE